MNGIDAALLTLCPPSLVLIVQEEALRLFIRYYPPCVYPLSDITAHDQISQAFPPILPTASDQILEVGMAWERGYPTTIFNPFHLSLFGFLSTSSHVVDL